jgi:hypothetical protein
MTIELDPNDPLFDAGPPVKAGTRIPRSPEAYAKTPWSALARRGNDDIFPQLTRLCLYLQIRSREGQLPVTLTNNALLDFGISRRQKYRLLGRLVNDGRITIDQTPGCHPVVAIVCPWW